MSNVNASLVKEYNCYECQKCKKLQRTSRLKKVVMTFFTLLIVPTCQSMPVKSGVSLTYIQQQNVQVINGNHNVSRQIDQSK